MTRSWGGWALERLDYLRPGWLPSLPLPPLLKEPELVGAATLGAFIALVNIIRLLAD